MTPTQRRTVQITSLALMFFFMCILRLWYSIFIFIGAGIIMTLVLRRRTYCGAYCPMGTLVEMMDQQKEKGLKGRYLWLPVFLLFFGSIAYILITYQGYDQAIWYYLLRLVVFIATFSILIQLAYKKRTWCTRLCPVGILLSAVSKRDAEGPAVNLEKCISCHDCTRACPLSAELAPPNVKKVDAKYCLQCYACEVACQHEAIFVDRGKKS
jgi:polyferredoxin